MAKKIYKVTQQQLETLQSGGTITVGGVSYTYETGSDVVYIVVDPSHPEYTLKNSSSNDKLQLYKDATLVSDLTVNYAARAGYATNAHTLTSNSTSFNVDGGGTINGSVTFQDKVGIRGILTSDQANIITGTLNSVTDETLSLVNKSYVDTSVANAIKNGTLTIQAEGTTKGTFSANQASNTTINIKASDLGLSSAMKFLGTTTTAISDGSTTNPITISGASVTATAGNVVLYGSKEFVWTGSLWEELGDESSHALKTITITGTGALGGGGNLSANRTITHNTTTRTNTTSTAAPGFGGTFTAVDSITSDSYGHISQVNTKTVTVPSTAATTSTAGLMSASDKTKLDGIATGANNYSLPTATSSTLGGIKLGSDTAQTVAANSVTSTASRTYAVQKNSSNQLVVNVPWTNTTYSFSASNPTLAWGATATIGTAGGTTYKVTMPANPNTDTHYTAYNYVGAADSASNAATSNGSTYLKLYENGTKRSQFKIAGSGATTVASDSSGNITINSTNTTYTAGTNMSISGTTINCKIDMSVSDGVLYITK